ncbi:carbohydrate ABC transporter permease [Actinotalea caeni]|uniref:carbohydrate ABC transporter permease n=1 Tax=Actinotalea caeni TaxID=1348467 RepID=UPI0012E16076|nr:carbohydrate ABC transporter permease [Actinotalea caeni]
MSDVRVRRAVASVAGRYSAVLALMLFLLLPAIWLVLSSLRPNREIFTSMPSWSFLGLTLDNYEWALSERGMGMVQLLATTLFVCAATAVLTAVFAMLAGYGLARYQGVGARAAVVILLLAQMIQGPMILIPWYSVTAQLGLLNTRTVLILIYQTITLPAAVWLMSSFFRRIPQELEEAAAIDGAGRLRTLAQVVLPIAMPGVAAVTMYAFILAWNDYQYALTLTSSRTTKTVQVGIAQVMESLGATNWGGIMASGVLAIVPVVIVFALVQKTLISGLTAGAVKG